MQKINLKINEKQKDYSIFIGTKIIQNTGSYVNCAEFSSALIVADKNLPLSVVKKIRNALPIESFVISLPAKDQEKNINNALKIWQALVDFGCDRKSLVINVGGGMIGDLGGFAASTYMRGLDFLQIPTTLLSQVDASVGGKVGINLSGIKNLIGSFQQPIAVIIDVDLLSTLPRREFISGFAEIIKHGLITDRKYFQFVSQKKPQDFSTNELEEIINRSVQIKADIVKKDEKENGSRKLLNFGHTIGHALESLSLKTRHPLLHGEAVSIGMAKEGKLSNLVGLLSNKDYQILENTIISSGLPVAISGISTDRVIEKIKSDKKNDHGKINWTLLKEIGKAIYNQNINDSIVKKIL